MQSISHYANRNAGGLHQEFIADSDDDPPETQTILNTIQVKDETLTHRTTKVKSDGGSVDCSSSAPSSPHHPSLPGEKLPILGKSYSWVSPKLEARTSKAGCGLFAVQPVKKGEYLVVWTGKIVSAEEALAIMATNEKHYILQIGDGFYQSPLQDEREAADLSNHSCEPTAGFGANSPICLTALRDLCIGEEVTFDYGMCETDERLWEPMECSCGSRYCRGLITAHDWKREDLWERYDGIWAPHVQKLVDQAKAAKKKAEWIEANQTPAASKARMMANKKEETTNNMVRLFTLFFVLLLLHLTK